MNNAETNNRKEESGTEQKALREEKENKAWQREYGVKLPFLLDKMNQLLADGSINAILELKSIFLDKDIFENYKQVDVFANMYVIISIYEIEAERGIQYTILNQGRTVEELLRYLFQLKMLFYRLDFGIGEDIENELMSFLISHHTSAINIEIMMTTSVIRPVITALKLEKVFKKYYIKEFDFSILQFMERHWKGNYRVQKRLLSDYGYMLDEKEAQNYEKNLKKILAVDEDEEVILELQELMWMLQYMEPDSEKEIAYYLKDHKISDQLWTFFIESADIQQADYYLRLTDALLEAKLQEKAKITLHHVRSMKPGDELVLCLLAELYMGEGKLSEAFGYLQEVGNPTDLTERLWNTCCRLEKKNDDK